MDLDEEEGEEHEGDYVEEEKGKVDHEATYPTNERWYSFRTPFQPTNQE